MALVCIISAIIVTTAVVVGLFLRNSTTETQYLQEEILPPSDDDHEIADIDPLGTIGGEVTAPTVNLRISKDYDDSLQNYRLGLITYDDLIEKVISVLQKSSWLTARRQPSMIWSIPADINSLYQIYVQSSLDNEYTTVFLVVNSTPINEVSIVYDGEYASAVYLSEETDDLILEVNGFQEVLSWQDIVQ